MTGSNGKLQIGQIRTSSFIGGSGTTPAGSIVAEAIGNVVSTGNINALIQATDSNAEVTFVNSQGGGIYGNILSTSGSIGTVQAAGAIGTTSSPVSIRFGTNIQQITGGSIVANVQNGLLGGDGKLQHFETTSGNFSGSLLTKTFEPFVTGPSTAITVTGDVAGTISIGSGSLARPIAIGGKLLSTGKIIIGGSNVLASPTDGVISVAASGLQGQVVMNALGNTAGTYWNRPVYIDSTITLAPGSSQPYMAPNYNAGDSALGGGAVGVVPFHLHDNDCVPVNGGSSAPIVTGSSVRLRFYGPVECPICTSTLAPVRVEYYQTDSPPSAGSTSRRTTTSPTTITIAT